MLYLLRARRTYIYGNRRPSELSIDLNSTSCIFGPRLESDMYFLNLGVPNEVNGRYATSRVEHNPTAGAETDAVLISEMEYSPTSRGRN